MTRRADRRRRALLDLLDEHGPHSRRELVHELRRRSIRSRRLNRDLFNLVLAGHIVCYRDPEWPVQHLYRLATAADRAEARRIDAWLREALHAAVGPLEGDLGSFQTDLDRRMANPEFRAAYEKQTRKLTRRQETDRG